MSAVLKGVKSILQESKLLCNVGERDLFFYTFALTGSATRNASRVNTAQN